MDKITLRRHFRSRREQLSAQDVAVASAALCQRLAGWLDGRAANQILTYLAFRNEPDPSLLFDLLPHVRWIVPRVVEGQRMILHPYNPAHLVRHRFGMLEPSADLPAADPDALNIVLVPGVAFDRFGGRMGFGGGYYDRFLLTTTALRVGITFDNCLADALPCDEHDQRMDWVVTPTQEIRCAPQTSTTN